MRNLILNVQILILKIWNSIHHKQNKLNTTKKQILSKIQTFKVAINGLKKFNNFESHIIFINC